MLIHRVWVCRHEMVCHYQVCRWVGVCLMQMYRC